MACPASVVNCPDRQKNNQQTVIKQQQQASSYDEAKRILQQPVKQNSGGVTIKTQRV
jgi:hypothetical protein